MIIVLAIFLVLRAAEAAGVLPVWASSYADDLLCLPLVLSLVLWAHRRGLGRGQQYVLPRSHGLATLLVFIIYFELLLPRLKAGPVADFYDVLMYCLGYLIFELALNRSRRAHSLPKNSAVTCTTI